MKQRYCGSCIHARLLPEQPRDDPMLRCFGAPPALVMVPVMVPPSVQNPRGGQGMQLSSMYPPVVANFPACAKFKAPLAVVGEG